MSATLLLLLLALGVGFLPADNVLERLSMAVLGTFQVLVMLIVGLTFVVLLMVMT